MSGRKYIKLKVGQKVRRWDYVSSKGNDYATGLLRVDEYGEIHIGHIITGEEACFCFRNRKSKP